LSVIESAAVPAELAERLIIDALGLLMSLRTLRTECDKLPFLTRSTLVVLLLRVPVRRRARRGSTGFFRGTRELELELTTVEVGEVEAVWVGVTGEGVEVEAGDDFKGLREVVFTLGGVEMALTREVVRRGGRRRTGRGGAGDAGVWIIVGGEVGRGARGAILNFPESLGEDGKPTFLLGRLPDPATRVT
jgi:hypothetical protein